MKKIYILVLCLIGITYSANAQINRYDRPSSATYTPLTFDEMARAASYMRQRANANEVLAEELMDLILELKGQTTDRAFLSKMDANYNKIENFYLEGNLAHVNARQYLKTIELEVKQEIITYNKRIEDAQRNQSYSSSTSNFKPDYSRTPHKLADSSGYTYQTKALRISTTLNAEPDPYKPIIEISAGTVLQVAKYNASYYIVRYGDQEGYIHQIYFQ